jgi:hypothetical protein
MPNFQQTSPETLADLTGAYESAGGHSTLSAARPTTGKGGPGKPKKSRRR